MNYIQQIDNLTLLIDALDPEHGITLCSIPDIVQIKYDVETHTPYILYNGDVYETFEDCMEQNDNVAELYYSILSDHLNYLQTLNNGGN